MFFTAESLKIQRGAGKNTKLILNGNSNCRFIIKSGTLNHLIGNSGVGKSTLLWALARLHPLLGGVMQLNEIKHSQIAVTQWRAAIALLPQKAVIMSGTVLDNLLYPFHTFRIQQEYLHKRHESLPTTQDLYQELQLLGLHDIALERDAVSLSGGQQSRLALLRLLLTKPQIILADEPTAGVDEVAADLIFERMLQFCETGRAIIFTNHRHSEHVNSSRIIISKQGELCCM